MKSRCKSLLFLLYLIVCKLNSSLFFVSAIAILFFSFCDKKKNNTTTTTTTTTGPSTSAPTNTIITIGTVISNSAVVTYEQNGPKNNMTVTGSATITNPATQNSSLLVGGAAWSNPTCASTNSLVLKAINGSIDVTLNFLFPPTTGTYAIAANPGPQACSITVLNAPNQPAGIIWYAKVGQVVVNTNSTSIQASFSGILCTQQNFNFPTVGISGAMGCN